MALPNQPRTLTEAEYLAFQEQQVEKYEYVAGRVVMMTGATLSHNTISTNISTTLNNQLRDTDCLVPSNDTRLKVESKSVSFRYPDVMVICGKPVLVDGHDDTINNPIIIIEILSPSTTLTDYNEKLSEYIALPSVQAYIIVSQHMPKLERFLRPESGDWLYTQVTDMDGALALNTINAELSLAEVYRKISFDSNHETS